MTKSNGNSDNESYKKKFKLAIEALRPYMKDPLDNNVFENAIADYDDYKKGIETFKIKRVRKRVKIPVPAIKVPKIGIPKVPKIDIPKVPKTAIPVPKLKPVKVGIPKVPKTTIPVPKLKPVKVDIPKVPNSGIAKVDIPKIKPIKVDIPKIKIPENVPINNDAIGKINAAKNIKTVKDITENKAIKLASDIDKTASKLKLVQDKKVTLANELPSNNEQLDKLESIINDLSMETDKRFKELETLIKNIPQSDSTILQTVKEIQEKQLEEEEIIKELNAKISELYLAIDDATALATSANNAITEVKATIYKGSTVEDDSEEEVYTNSNDQAIIEYLQEKYDPISFNLGIMLYNTEHLSALSFDEQKIIIDKMLDVFDKKSASEFKSKVDNIFTIETFEVDKYDNKGY